MEIDPYSIYLIQDFGTTDKLPYELPNLTSSDEFKANNGQQSPIDFYNYYVAKTLKDTHKEVDKWLKFHFINPACDKLLFIYNLTYKVLEVPRNGKFYEYANDRVLANTEAEIAILDWLEGIQFSYDEFGDFNYDHEKIQDAEASIELQIAAADYLKRVNSFPTFPRQEDELLFMKFLMNRNPRSIYKSMRNVEQNKSSISLWAIQEIFQDAKINDALDLVTKDIEKYKRINYE